MTASVGARLRTGLARALSDVGLWPDPSLYDTLRPEITARGEREVRRLGQRVGRRALRDGLRSLPVPVSSASAVRILGFGTLLTEYVVSPLHLDPECRARVARLGALANLIVAVYDDLMDGSDGEPSPIRRSALTGSGALRRLRLLQACHVGPASRRLTARLVRTYYQELAELPRHPETRAIRRLLLRTIVLMYDAEEKTIRPASPVDARSMRRKAALPFLVMGLPGWLMRPESRMTVPEHLRWLYRLGIFLGSVDDAVDLEADGRAGHPNLLRASMSSDQGLGVEVRGIAERVASVGARVQREWTSRGCDEGLERVVQHSLGLVTCSWFGGPGWRPSAESGGVPPPASPEAARQGVSRGCSTNGVVSFSRGA